MTKREKYYALNKEKIKERVAKWAKENPDRRKGYCRKTQLRKYGLSPEDFSKLLASQNGRCGICGTDVPGKRGWHVDHEHVADMETRSLEERRATVRGILCHRCNLGLGALADSPDRLRKAAMYLERYRFDVRAA